MRMHQASVPVRMHVRLAAVPVAFMRVPVVRLVHMLVFVLDLLVRMVVFVVLGKMQPYA